MASHGLDPASLRPVAALDSQAPPDVDGLMQDLDSGSSGSQMECPDQPDQPQELTYVDIDTFLVTL